MLETFYNIFEFIFLIYYYFCSFFLHFLPLRISGTPSQKPRNTAFRYAGNKSKNSRQQHSNGCRYLLFLLLFPVCPEFVPCNERPTDLKFILRSRLPSLLYSCIRLVIVRKCNNCHYHINHSQLRYPCAHRFGLKHGLFCSSIQNHICGLG